MLCIINCSFASLCPRETIIALAFSSEDPRFSTARTKQSLNKFPFPPTVIADTSSKHSRVQIPSVSFSLAVRNLSGSSSGSDNSIFSVKNSHGIHPCVYCYFSIPDRRGFKFWSFLDASEGINWLILNALTFCPPVTVTFFPI